MNEERKFNMEDLMRVENNQTVIDSRKVAEMIDKRHTDLLRDIDHYVEVISENAELRFQDFFIKSTYKEILQKNNVPYQRYVKAGYFELSESYHASHGKLVVDLTTYVTQKGLDYIRKLLK